MTVGYDVFNYGHSFSLATEDECSPKDDCEYCQIIPGGKKILKRHNYNHCNYPSNNGCALITGPTKRHDGKSMFTVAHPKENKSFGRGSWDGAVTLAKSWSLSECDCSNGYIDMTATHGEWKDDDSSTHGASYPIKSPEGCNDTYSWGDQETQMGKRGCTDPTADNYDKGAVNDDGSCNRPPPTPLVPDCSEDADCESDETCVSGVCTSVDDDDGEGMSKLVVGGLALVAVVVAVTVLA